MRSMRILAYLVALALHWVICGCGGDDRDGPDDDDDAIITIVGDDPDHGYVRSENDWALNGADIDENNSGAVFDWTDFYGSATVETANSALRTAIESGAGQQHVALPPQ